MSVGKEKLFLVRVEFVITAHFIRNSASPTPVGCYSEQC